MMSVVIVKNDDRVAFRIVSARVPPVERTTADDQCQQRSEHSAHGSSLTCAEPHSSESSHGNALVSISRPICWWIP